MPSTLRQTALSPARLIALPLALVVLTGCQSLATDTVAHVRVIDLSPDLAAVDLYHGSTALAYNLSFGTVTSYVPVVPGVSSVTVDLAGSRQVLTSTGGTFVAGAFYTVLVNNAAVTLHPLLLTDQAQATSPHLASAASGPAVRFIHQAFALGPVDVYLVHAGQRVGATPPIATNLLPGATTAYLAAPMCTCAAVALPAGTVSWSALAPHALTQIDFVSGAHTLILLDPRAESTATAQILTTVDAEP